MPPKTWKDTSTRCYCQKRFLSLKTFLKGSHLWTVAENSSLSSYLNLSAHSTIKCRESHGAHFEGRHKLKYATHLCFTVDFGAFVFQVRKLWPHALSPSLSKGMQLVQQWRLFRLCLRKSQSVSFWGQVATPSYDYVQWTEHDVGKQDHRFPKTWVMPLSHTHQDTKSGFS